MTTFARIDFSKFKTQYATTEKQVKRTDDMKKSTALARAQAKDAAAKAARKAAAALRAKEYNKIRYSHLLPRYKAYVKWCENDKERIYTAKWVMRLFDYVVELGYQPEKWDQPNDSLWAWKECLLAYSRHRIKELS